MTARNILDEIESKGKVYNQKMVCIAAFFGGPLGAGYLMIENYKALHQREKVPPAWFIAIVGMLVYMAVAVSINLYIIDIPDILYGLLSMFAANTVYKKEQEDAVAEHLKDGGSLHNGWRVAGVLGGIFVLIIALIGSGAYLFFTAIEGDISPVPISEEIAVQEDLTGETITSSVYGALDHVISYDRTQLTRTEADALGEELTNLGYFGEEVQRVLHVEEDRTAYTLFLIETEERANNVDIRKTYGRLKNELVLFLETSDVQLVLIDEDWEVEYATF